MHIPGAVCPCSKETFRFASSTGLQIPLTVPSENSERKTLIAFVSSIKSGRGIHALFLEMIISCPACNHVQYGISFSWTKLDLFSMKAYCSDSSPKELTFLGLYLCSHFSDFSDSPRPHFHLQQPRGRVSFLSTTT